ncbi:hypothetical protein F4777DRAFT_597257 [Nemania sp. FL0916]|nr:hypothetical protein F4777DRAFT_597257 [Nemania sp. FL0916]
MAPHKSTSSRKHDDKTLRERLFKSNDKGKAPLLDKSLISHPVPLGVDPRPVDPLFVGRALTTRDERAIQLPSPQPAPKIDVRNLGHAHEALHSHPTQWLSNVARESEKQKKLEHRNFTIYETTIAIAATVTVIAATAPSITIKVTAIPAILIVLIVVIAMTAVTAVPPAIEVTEMTEGIAVIGANTEIIEITEITIIIMIGVIGITGDPKKSIIDAATMKDEIAAQKLAPIAPLKEETAKDDQCARMIKSNFTSSQDSLRVPHHAYEQLLVRSSMKISHLRPLRQLAYLVAESEGVDVNKTPEVVEALEKMITDRRRLSSLIPLAETLCEDQGIEFNSVKLGELPQILAKVFEDRDAAKFAAESARKSMERQRLQLEHELTNWQFSTDSDEEYIYTRERA